MGNKQKQGRNIKMAARKYKAGQGCGVVMVKVQNVVAMQILG